MNHLPESATTWVTAEASGRAGRAGRIDCRRGEFDRAVRKNGQRVIAMHIAG